MTCCEVGAVVCRDGAIAGNVGSIAGIGGTTDVGGTVGIDVTGIVGTVSVALSFCAAGASSIPEVVRR
jgi:hypothetical protein